MNKYQLKAIELVDKYFKDEKLYWDLSYNQAIQCAIIAVDELIANEHLEAGDASFWEPVKDELLKMK
jgi:hypothetical protein